MEQTPYQGTINRSANLTDEFVSVILPGISDGDNAHAFNARWRNAAPLPQKGEACVVVQTDRDLWLIGHTPAGPVDPGGGPGPASIRQQFSQSQASATWTFTYQGDVPPSVTVVDSNNQVVIGNVSYVPQSKQVIVKFGSPMSGQIYLS